MRRLAGSRVSAPPTAATNSDAQSRSPCAEDRRRTRGAESRNAQNVSTRERSRSPWRMVPGRSDATPQPECGAPIPWRARRSSVPPPRSLAPSAQAQDLERARAGAVADAGVLRASPTAASTASARSPPRSSRRLGERTASRDVSVTAFDARLVEQLGLTDVAARAGRGARAEPARSTSAPRSSPASSACAPTTRPSDDAIELYPWRADHARRGRPLASPILDAATGRPRTPAQQLSAFELPAYDASTEARAARRGLARSACPTSGAARPTRRRAPTATRPTAATTAPASSGACSSSPATPRATHRRPHRRPDGGRDPQVASASASTTSSPAT